MQKNNKKMTCLAAILMAALAALLIFAIVDANRINRSLSELQQTVDYEERLEPLLFHGATAETAETCRVGNYAKMGCAIKIIAIGCNFKIISYIRFRMIQDG